MIKGHRKKKAKKSPLQSTAISEEGSLVASIIEGSSDIDPEQFAARIPDIACARAVAERLCLEAEPRVSFLLALKARFEDKLVHKSIRRALFKLKQKGIVTEDVFVPVGPLPAIGLAREEPPNAFIGPILNMSGSRAVLITHFKGHKERYVGAGIVSDKDGIYDFFYNASGKKLLSELKDRLSENAGPLVETSLAHAASVLYKAYDSHIELHNVAPPSYLEFRPWLLENAPALDHAVVYDFVPEASVSDNVLTDLKLERLFRHQLLETWLIEPGVLQSFMEELLNIEESPILLSDAQKYDQADRIRQNCISQVFPQTEQAMLKCRLEEMAYFFLRHGEEEFCRLCLDAAQSPGQKGGDIINNPVITYLVNKSIDFYMDIAGGGQPEDKSSIDSPKSNIII